MRGEVEQIIRIIRSVSNTAYNEMGRIGGTDYNTVV